LRNVSSVIHIRVNIRRCQILNFRHIMRDQAVLWGGVINPNRLCTVINPGNNRRE